MIERAKIVTAGLACLGQTGPQPWATEAGLHLGAHDNPAWCGLFVRTIWRRRGATIPDWVIGSGNTHYLRQRPADEQGLPGDLVCLHGSLGHQALLVEHVPEYGLVRLINGNGRGGVVTYSETSPEYVLAIFDPSECFKNA